MKISFLLPLVIGSSLLMPALFAETSGTSTATGTGVTSTGTVSTGTTNTGSTGTGVTSTGMTNTGSTSTGGVRCYSGTKIDTFAAQEKFALETARLISEKRTAYTLAQSLTGSARTEAIKTANLKFREGYKSAQREMMLAKKTSRTEVKACKVEKRENRREDRRDNRSDDSNDDSRGERSHDDSNDDDDNDNHKQKGKMKNEIKEVKKLKNENYKRNSRD